jgi:hypothetical protein
MQTEPSPCTPPGNIDPILEKVNKVEAMLEKQAVERKGNGTAAMFALGAAILYFGSAWLFPNAGKQQRPIAVEFTSMAINQSALQNTYNQNLAHLLSELPGPGGVTLKFSSSQGELANKFIRLNAMVVDSVTLSGSVTAFLPVILDDYHAQRRAEALSPAQVAELEQMFKRLDETISLLGACSKKLDGEVRTYQLGMKAGAPADVQAQALVQMTTTLASVVRGQSEAVKCMQTVDQFSAAFPRLEQIHDSGVVEFNKRADRDSWWLALSRSVAGLLLFFTGNPTRSYLQGLWLKAVKKKPEEAAMV